MRIIGGKWRGRKLPVLHREGLRPTTDRSKETLFNWLMHEVRGQRCLDAFSGSASLGLEALSRGAREQTFYELDKSAAQHIKKQCETLNANAIVKCGDAKQLIASETQPFDGIFIDPPFEQGLLIPFVDCVLQQHKLNNDGWLYLEYEANLTLPHWPQLIKHREKKTSQFVYALYFYQSE